jgi:hypothetical protein
MSDLGRKQTLGSCPQWVEIGHHPKWRSNASVVTQSDEHSSDLGGIPAIAPAGPNTFLIEERRYLPQRTPPICLGLLDVWPNGLESRFRQYSPPLYAAHDCRSTPGHFPHGFPSRRTTAVKLLLSATTR